MLAPAPSPLGPQRQQEAVALGPQRMAASAVRARMEGRREVRLQLLLLLLLPLVQLLPLLLLLPLVQRASLAPCLQGRSVAAPQRAPAVRGTAPGLPPRPALVPALSPTALLPARVPLRANARAMWSGP